MNLKGKSVLVTGGAGFIGGHLVDRIIQEKPAKLVVLDNFHLGQERNIAEAKKNFPDLVVEKVDLTNYALTKQVMERHSTEVVFDLAVLCLPESLEKPEHVFRQNTEMAITICRLQREDAFKTLVHFSSSEVYGTAVKVPMGEDHPLGAKTTYAASKVASDNLVLSYRELYGTDCTIVRPFNNYGPRQNEKAYSGVIPLTIKRLVKNEQPVVFGTGQQTRDYIYVTDTAEAAVLAYNEKNTRGKIINIASGRETSIQEIVEKLVELIKPGTEIRHEQERQGDVRRHIADISLAKNILGFKPQVSLDVGLARTVEWYKKNGMFH